MQRNHHIKVFGGWNYDAAYRKFHCLHYLFFPPKTQRMIFICLNYSWKDNDPSQIHTEYLYLKSFLLVGLNWPFKIMKIITFKLKIKMIGETDLCASISNIHLELVSRIFRGDIKYKISVVRLLMNGSWTFGTFKVNPSN